MYSTGQLWHHNILLYTGQCTLYSAGQLWHHTNLGSVQCSNVSSEKAEQVKGVRVIMVVLYQLNCGKVLDHVKGVEGEGDQYSDYTNNSLR